MLVNSPSIFAHVVSVVDTTQPLVTHMTNALLEEKGHYVGPVVMDTNKTSLETTVCQKDTSVIPQCL